MTTLQHRPNTALLIIDMQVGVIAKAVGRDAVVGNVATLVAQARLEQVPVIGGGTPTSSSARAATVGRSFRNSIQATPSP